MRYISKHEADVYLDKEVKKKKIKIQDRGKGLDSDAVFKCHVCTGVNSCSCTMPWDVLTFVLVFSIPHRKFRGNISHHKWAEKKEGN